MASLCIASEDPESWVGRFSRRVAESLFAVLFPSNCRLCGDPLIKISRLPVCRECLAAMHRIAGEVCGVCGERIFSSLARLAVGDDGCEPRCGLCRRVEQPFVKAVAYGSYDGGLRELIHLLKYASVRPSANVLGRMLAEAIAGLDRGFASGVLVVPVPLYHAKLRRLEFNHAELIARAAIRLSSTPHLLHLSPSLLERKRETLSQTGLNRHQRRENVRGAFRVAHPEAVKGRDVLVVDDVYTTGATVSECARVLRRAGAARVWVATVARTLKNQDHHVQVEMPDESTGESVYAAEFQQPVARAASG
jgi:ComF family protein